MTQIVVRRLLIILLLLFHAVCVYMLSSTEGWPLLGLPFAVVVLVVLYECILVKAQEDVKFHEGVAAARLVRLEDAIQAKEDTQLGYLKLLERATELQTQVDRLTAYEPQDSSGD